MENVKVETISGEYKEYIKDADKMSNKELLDFARASQDDDIKKAIGEPQTVQII
ncbi:MAG: hypothetical protein WC310_05970 [Patescibacteria group bacterium]|jgi:hypothetical protein